MGKARAFSMLFCQNEFCSQDGGDLFSEGMFVSPRMTVGSTRILPEWNRWWPGRKKGIEEFAFIPEDVQGVAEAAAKRLVINQRQWVSVVVSSHSATSVGP